MSPCSFVTMPRRLWALMILAWLPSAVSTFTPVSASDLTLLFIGDSGHHQPARRFQELAPVLERRGIELRYTQRMADLNPSTLKAFDGVVLYANIDRIEDEQAAALLDFVAGGKGFVPLHCASYCWRNNPEIVALMGGQFLRHGTGIVSTQGVAPEHPVMKGFEGFSSWDETYVHHRHNTANRTVLEYRVGDEQAEGNDREPWTWVRTHRRGRVFYTAWGHDGRTFTQPGFHNLVERGIRWACGQDPAVVPDFRDVETFDVPAMTTVDDDAVGFQYVDVGPKIPNYTPSRQWGTQGDPKTLMQMPLDPEESIKRFVTPVGLSVERYADERDFQSKPIAMTWDERGRLWVCETVDYPNELGQGRDRIRICEDTDGDHVADRFTVFADGLSIPTSIVIVRGGAVVQNGTETIYLKDTDGDDVADQRTTLIEGWALGDTHGGVSNFRYGLDNWIWAMQGYNNSTPTYDGKQSQSFRQGFWRFKLSQSDPPVVTDLEFVRSSDNNTWGLGIGEDGLIFGSTANHNPSMFMPIANRYYERVRGWSPSTLHSIADTHEFDPITDNVRQVDHHGGYTAGAGHALYTARAFPRQWWNRTAFVCGPTGHLVGTFVLSPDGANFQSTSPVNLLASDDEWSAPIMAEVGPDGAVWVIDWYNYIVQHNPTPNGFETGQGRAYESDLRDKTHGRIYRVVPDDDQRLHTFDDLSQSSNQELVDSLSHPSMRWRLHAQRLLVERDLGQDVEVVTGLMDLVSNREVDAIGLNVAAIHALHTLGAMLQTSGPQTETTDSKFIDVLENAVRHPSSGVRRNALAVLPKSESGGRLLLRNREVFDDVDAQVRLQAVLTLSDMPAMKPAGRLVAELCRGQTDPIMLDALTSAAATHAPSFLRQIAKTRFGRESMAVVSPITQRVTEHVARGRPDSATLQRLLEALSGAEPNIAGAMVDGLLAGWPKDHHVSATDTLGITLRDAFRASRSAGKVQLLRLAAAAGLDTLDDEAESILAGLRDTVSDPDVDPQKRIRAAQDWIAFRSDDPDVVDSIVQEITPQTDPALAAGFLNAVSRSRSEEAAELIIDALSTLTPQVKSAAIGVMIGKPSWTLALLDAAEADQFDINELTLEQKQQLRSFPDRRIRRRAEAKLALGGGLPDADREKVLQSLMHVTNRTGNVKAGKEVFKKVCSVCHQYGDLGQKVGPNLTGMAAHPKSELLTHIIDPSRNVEGNYRLYNVLTVDGQVFSGMLAGESRTSITIIDAQAKEIRLAREDIEELIASRKSVMPEGFEKQISEDELADLLQFLTDQGPFVPIPLDDAATAISTRGLFSQSDRGPDRMVFDNWDPKTFNGVPFVLTDPMGQSQKNLILLRGPRGTLPPRMPASVSLPCGTSASAIHLLSGVGGWSYPFEQEQSVSMIVRLHYADGSSEDHELINGLHFADYIRRVDVPKSEFAFALGDQQIRYLKVVPSRSAKINTIELVKGEDSTAPIVMAVTVQRDESDVDAETISAVSDQSDGDERSLKAAVGDRYKIGVGVSHRVIDDPASAELIQKHFQILTPENCMKPQGIHPAEDEWDFAATDKFVDFARKHGLEVVGHCLVWAKDDRTDTWMMKDVESDVGRDKLMQRIETHIETVVQRYADAVTMWDVVNEAIGDGDEGLLRDSVYSRTTGIDFIVKAFQVARANDPDALLIYNDYNGHKPDKRKKLIEFLTKLKAAGAPVDAYGMQGHFEIGDESIDQLRETFQELRRLGLQVVVSELDIDVVKRGRWWSEDGKYRDELSAYDPYPDGMSDDIRDQQTRQYVQLFELFDEYSDIIARVSFWNLHDGESWLNTFPWRRVNHPLLFDRDLQPKPAFDAVYDTLKQ
uniref:PVC-type heme-binding CxxCH protein n=1 Tax=Crateriforma spongiae TaxID=2724528 RepID=UPI001F2CB412|nr:PVC-type heme-binding CxxCH protein [Crateriforma spongiae]